MNLADIFRMKLIDKNSDIHNFIISNRDKYEYFTNSSNISSMKHDFSKLSDCRIYEKEMDNKLKNISKYVEADFFIHSANELRIKNKHP
jgi:hypothetical protein